MKNMKIISLITVFSLVSGIAASAQTGDLADKLKGRILLQVEDHGEAWFVEPEKKERVFLGRPADAFRIMREFGLGITDDDLAKIASEDESLRNESFARRLAGKILLQVQKNGEAWFVDPVTLKRHFLGRPDDAFNVMRSLGLGIKTSDLNKIIVREGRGVENDARRQVKVAMSAQNNSGEQGMAELKDFGAKTKVEIELLGAPAGVIQPAHIHTGSCAAIGGIAFPLNDVVNGKSETMLDVTLDDLLGRLPLAVNVHKSVPEIATAVSCGDISAIVIPARQAEARDDKSFKVRAEIVGNSAEVTVKSEFTTAETGRTAITGEALANLRADRQRIADRLRIETEDSRLSSRIRAEARVEDSQAEVKAEVRFIVASADPSVIVDETFKKLSSLAASEIDSVLELEIRG